MATQVVTNSGILVVPAAGTWQPAIPPPSPHSKEAVTCKGCQETGLFWSWNFYLGRPLLVTHQNHMHFCPTPQTRDVFPGWCDTCKAPELIWLRKQTGFELTESYGLPHTCEIDPAKAIQDMSSANCKFCKTTDLFWVKTNDRFTLTHSDGTRHTCETYAPYMKDWAEAKRMDYALEKAWLKAIPDGTPCKKCNGRGHTTWLSKNKKVMQKYLSSEPITMYRPCRQCKRMGVFSVSNKKWHLKELRKRYWPFKGGYHKWAKYDKGG